MVINLPGMNKTESIGFGPKTGRGFGNCGCGTHRGQQWKLSDEDERKIVEAELKEIEYEKEKLQRRLDELNS